MKTKHRVIIQNTLPKRKVYEPIQRAVLFALQHHKAPSGELVVTLAPSEEVRRLNNQFRQQDNVTDVLTFPGPEFDPTTLGDVVVNWDVAVYQAQKRCVKPVEEAAMLAVHGALHLVGFEDHTPNDQAQMIAAMNAAMQAVGLPTDESWMSVPYEEYERIG